MSTDEITNNDHLETSHNFVDEDDDNIKSSFDQSQDESETDTIGNFTLGKTIGKGSFGKVKIGIHQLTKEKVAIKILDKSKMSEESDFIHVQKEISILKRLRHKNIIQLYEVIESDEKLYIVMEFAEGGDLFEVITRSGKLDEHTACLYFHQIICALEYIHTLNIAHRDIKPENMLLDYKNEIKLSDFGLSNFYSDNENLMMTPCGTPVFASPELLNGDSYHGMFNDIWSAGISLYAMLTGNVPFDSSNQKVLIDLVIFEDFTTPFYVSEEAKELLRGMLEKDPLKRYDFQMIKKSKWFNTCEFILYPGIIMNYHTIPVDDKILFLIENVYNEDKDNIRESLENFEFNEFTTTYFLMLRKFIKEGGKSISDLRSAEYLEYMADTENIKNEKYLSSKLYQTFQSESLQNLSQFDSEDENEKNQENELVTPVKTDAPRKKTIIEVKIAKAKKSIMNYYINREPIPNHVDEIEKPEMKLGYPKLVPRPSKMRRTVIENNHIFLDILEKKTLQDADSQDADKLVEYYLEKKNFIDHHIRNSIAINFQLPNFKKIEEMIASNQNQKYEINLNDKIDEVPGLDLDESIQLQNDSKLINNISFNDIQDAAEFDKNIKVYKGEEKIESSRKDKRKSTNKSEKKDINQISKDEIRRNYDKRLSDANKNKNLDNKGINFQEKSNKIKSPIKSKNSSPKKANEAKPELTDSSKLNRKASQQKSAEKQIKSRNIKNDNDKKKPKVIDMSFTDSIKADDNGVIESNNKLELNIISGFSPNDNEKPKTIKNKIVNKKSISNDRNKGNGNNERPKKETKGNKNDINKNSNLTNTQNSSAKQDKVEKIENPNTDVSKINNGIIKQSKINNDELRKDRTNEKSSPKKKPIQKKNTEDRNLPDNQKSNSQDFTPKEKNHIKKTDPIKVKINQKFNKDIDQDSPYLDKKQGLIIDNTIVNKEKQKKGDMNNLVILKHNNDKNESPNKSRIRKEKSIEDNKIEEKEKGKKSKTLIQSNTIKLKIKENTSDKREADMSFSEKQEKNNDIVKNNKVEKAVKISNNRTKMNNKFSGDNLSNIDDNSEMNSPKKRKKAEDNKMIKLTKEVKKNKSIELNHIEDSHIKKNNIKIGQKSKLIKKNKYELNLSFKVSSNLNKSNIEMEVQTPFEKMKNRSNVSYSAVRNNQQKWNNKSKFGEISNQITLNSIEYSNNSPVKTFKKVELTVQEVEKIKQVSIPLYKGIIDIVCCFYFEKLQLYKRILYTLKKLKILYVSISTARISCHIENVRIRMEIFNIDYENCFYIHFIKTFGTQSDFKDLVKKILFDLKSNSSI